MKQSHRLRILVALVVGMFVGCAGQTQEEDPKMRNDRKQVRVIQFPGADRIVVRYAPSADFSSKDAKSGTLADAGTIRRWLEALGKIPYEGPGLMMKLAADAPEYEIAFYAGATVLGSLRIKAGALDAPGGEGWDFYEGGEDRAFVELVKAFLS